MRVGMRQNIYRSEFETDGFSICREVLSRDTVKAIAAAIDRVTGQKSAYGVRNLLERLPAVADLVSTEPIRSLVEPILGLQAFPVRAILFDKVPEANWGVPWHQDLTIAVKEKVEIDGYGAWSIKAGIPHVQPPTTILENMVTLRIHLDDTDATNGALLAIPGSHSKGRLSPAETARLKERSQTYLCETRAGDVLAMRPLLVHASRKGTKPGRRRVIHVEFSSSCLPAGLEWFEASPTATAALRGDLRPVTLDGSLVSRHK